MTSKRIGGEEGLPSLSISTTDADLVCGACLMDLFVDDHEFLGAPAGCPHLFHWDCITSWAELQNTCPQCKLRFRMVGKYRSHDRAFMECVKFKKRDRVGRVSADDVEPDAPLELCEKCECPGGDDDMILCDGMDFTCNALYHYKCVGFDSVPSGLWFCESCISKGYIPDELKQVDPVPEIVSPAPKKRRPLNPSSPPPPVRVMPAPVLFPRTLVIQEGATRCKSSAVPRALLQPTVELPVIRPATSAAPQSVFARFRQRRLELKQRL